MEADDRERWLSDLNSPIRGTRGSGRVSQAVVDEEMSLFQRAQGALT